MSHDLVQQIKKFVTPELLSIVLTITVAFIALYISFTHNLILSYNDGNAHLDTARRVIDSLTPGLVQLGSVWLPLLHILLIPFVTNFYLWQSGLAGSIVSMASFFVSAYFSYQLVLLYTKNKWIAFIGVLILVTNANLLYMQTTPMFEPLSLATALGAVYFFAKWSLNDQLSDLILAAFTTMLFSMTRYDGWAFFLAGIIFVCFITLVKFKKIKQGEVIIYTFLGGIGIALWVVYNWLIFGDPLYFQNGPYSAYAQQQILAQRHQLPTMHNILLSLADYSLVTVLTVGIVLTAILVIGLIIYFWDTLKKPALWAPLLLFVVFAFNVYGLYSGNSVLWLPMIPPYFPTYFNSRYGIEMIPAAMFFGSYLASKNIILRWVIIIIVLVQPILFFDSAILQPLFHTDVGIVTLKDTVSSLNPPTLSASSYLHNHYKSGLILVSSASEDSFIFHVGEPLKDFITEGTGYYWNNSLKDPARYATWIVFFVNHTDRVGKVIADNAILHKDFKNVYTNNTYEIWKKV
jgi:hypothetical protein